MLKKILGVVAGLIVGVITVAIVESIGHIIFPPPEGVDLKDPEALKSIMHTIPLGAKIAVLVAWGLGVFAGGVTARLLSGRAPYAAGIVAVFLLAGGGFTMTQIPHPSWMVVSAVLVTLAGMIAAIKMTPAKPTA